MLVARISIGSYLVRRRSHTMEGHILLYISWTEGEDDGPNPPMATLMCPHQPPPLSPTPFPSPRANWAARARARGGFVHNIFRSSRGRGPTRDPGFAPNIWGL
jgi:hypothetical protein